MPRQHTAGIFADMSIDGEEIGTLVIVVDRAKNLPNRRTMGKQNPYCAVRLAKYAMKTETDVRGGQTPRWDQELRFTVHDSPDYYKLKVSVFNEDKRTDLVGETFIDLSDVVKPGGGQSDVWHNLHCKGRYAGEIRLEMTYYDIRPRPEPVVQPQSASQDLRNGSSRSTAVKRRPLPTQANGVPQSHRFGPRELGSAAEPETPSPQPQSQPEMNAQQQPIYEQPRALPHSQSQDYSNEYSDQLQPVSSIDSAYWPEQSPQQMSYAEHEEPLHPVNSYELLIGSPYGDVHHNNNSRHTTPQHSRTESQGYDQYSAAPPHVPSHRNELPHSYSEPIVNSIHSQYGQQERMIPEQEQHQHSFQQQGYHPAVYHQPHVDELPQISSPPPPAPPTHRSSLPGPSPYDHHQQHRHHPVAPPAHSSPLYPNDRRAMIASDDALVESRFIHEQQQQQQQQQRGFSTPEHQGDLRHYHAHSHSEPNIAVQPPHRGMPMGSSQELHFPQQPQQQQPWSAHRTPPHRHPLAQQQNISPPQRPNFQSQQQQRDGPPVFKPIAISPNQQENNPHIRPTPPSSTRVTPTRKSITPRSQSEPFTGQSSIPFSPDSFDAFNPNLTGRPSGNSYHNTNSPSYDPNRREAILNSEGQEIDPSDHLPTATWAPEPERKNLAKANSELGAAERRENRLGPRGAKPLPNAGGMMTTAAVRTKGGANVPITVSRRAYDAKVAPLNVRPMSHIEPDSNNGRNRLTKNNTGRPQSAIFPEPSQPSSLYEIPPVSSAHEYQGYGGSAATLPASMRKVSPSGWHGSPIGSAVQEEPSYQHTMSRPPPIPAKVPLAPYAQQQMFHPEGSMAALSEEMRSIDIGGMRAAPPTNTGRVVGGKLRAKRFA